MRYHSAMPRNFNTLVAFSSGVLVGALAVGAFEFQEDDPSQQPAPNVTATSSPTVSQNPNAPCHMRGDLPDPVCTPGATNPEVTQSNINSTICVSGYTAKIRPPVSYTNKLKQQQMLAYGFTDSVRLHTEDHLISLELGGAPKDAKNLWPEPDASPNPKDKIENKLHAAVCAGRISLRAAQVRIATNWTTAARGLE